MPPAKPEPTTRVLFLYFLRLGATAFGGAAPQLAAMERDWVRDRGWATPDDFARGVALSTLCPGPVGSQLAAYLGRLRGGARGATAALIGFLLPSFVMIVALAEAYGRWGRLPGPRAFASGAGCAVIAVIIKSASGLTKTMLGRRPSSWLIAAATGLLTAVAPAGAAAAVLVSAAACAFADSRPSRRGALGAAPSAWLALALMGAKAGLLTFGTGLAILPVIRAHAVGHGWVTDAQFVDAVSAGLVTPGPIVMAAAFVGDRHAGLPGALAATIGLFLPVWALTLLLAPALDRGSNDARVRGFSRGAMAAAMGSIAAAVLAMAGAALTDPVRLAVAAASAALLVLLKTPDPLVILAGGTLGWAFL